MPPHPAAGRRGGQVAMITTARTLWCSLANKQTYIAQYISSLSILGCNPCVEDCQSYAALGRHRRRGGFFFWHETAIDNSTWCCGTRAKALSGRLWAIAGWSRRHRKDTGLGKLFAYSGTVRVRSILFFRAGFGWLLDPLDLGAPQWGGPLWGSRKPSARNESPDHGGGRG
jgi:hypothetical protein